MVKNSNNLDAQIMNTNDRPFLFIKYEQSSNIDPHSFVLNQMPTLNQRIDNAINRPLPKI